MENEGDCKLTGTQPSNTASALPPYAPAEAATGPQQPNAVVPDAGQQQPTIAQKVTSYVGHVYCSCVVLWLCNPVFGLIAFTFAGYYNIVIFHHLSHCCSTGWEK